MTADLAFQIVAQVALDASERHRKTRAFSASHYEGLLRTLSWSSGVPYPVLHERLCSSVNILALT